MSKEERDLNFKKLFLMYVKKWWIIAVSIIFGVAVLGGYIFLTASEAYTQVTKEVIITNSDEPETQGIYEMKNTMQRSYYQSMLGSRTFIEALSEKLSFDISASELQKMIKVEYTTDTAVFKINIAGQDKGQTEEIADTLVDFSKSYMEDNLKVTDFFFFVLDSYETEINSNSEILIGALIGAVVGFIISIAVLFILFISDKKIYDEEDLKYYLDLPCLGTFSAEKDMIANELEVKYPAGSLLAVCNFSPSDVSVAEQLAHYLNENGKRIKVIRGKDLSFKFVDQLKQANTDADLTILDLYYTENFKQLNLALAADSTIFIVRKGENAVKLGNIKEKFENCGIQMTDTVLVE